jgi:mannose-6-phosphate isomerase-like protein (cupin superfamily)
MMKVTNISDLETTELRSGVPPGERLGKHVDTAEETQVLFSGEGELLLDDGAKPIRSGDFFVLPEGTSHDLRNTGSEDLRTTGPSASAVARRQASHRDAADSRDRPEARSSGSTTALRAPSLSRGSNGRSGPGSRLPTPPAWPVG